ncbi:MAG: TonB-dependent receptor [Bacteroidetes bacterium]|nr:TonB-dependent receptor [Bacteroidota bacterium]
MKFRTNFRLLLIILFLIGHSHSNAQNARITGKVKDSQTNEPIIGANLIVVGTSIGAATDINGEFTIFHTPIESKELRVSYLGYKTKTIDIFLTEGIGLYEEILLDSDVLEFGSEIVVSAQRTGQVAAINQQLSSEQLVNVVSSDKMLEFPDANVAESVSRLPGVSINRDGGEGSSVVVRGLSAKYSKVTVDGVDMASTGAQERGTNLSGIAQENLKGIELYKSPTADMDGEAIGGTVNLQTGKASDSPVAIARMFGFYNGLENNFNQYSMFGKYSNRYVDGNLGVQLSVNYEDRDRSTDFFSGSYIVGATIDDVTHIRINNSQVTDRLENRKRIGGNLILDYNIGNGYIMLSSFLSKTTRDIEDRQRSLDVDAATGTIQIRETERSLQSYVNTLRGEHTFGQFETDWSASFSYSRNERPFDHWMRFNETPDFPNANDVSKEQNALDYYKFVGVDSTAPLYTTQFMKEDVQERNYTGQLNFKYHFNFGSDINGYIKFGGKLKHINRERRYEEAQFWAYLLTQPGQAGKLNAEDFLDPDYTPSNFLDGRAELGLILDAGSNRSFYDEYSSSARYVNSKFYAYRSSVGTSAGIPNYKAEENVSAAYFMPRFNFGTLITFIPGLRFEAVNNKYFGNTFVSLVSNAPTPNDNDFIISDTTSTVKYNDLLPMIHLRVKPTEWFDIRLSYTRTLSRPDYNYLIPSQSLNNFGATNVYKGNSDLKPARSNNYDAYLSFYEPTLGFVSFGYFYKDIKDISAIYTTNVTQDLVTEGLPEFGIPPLANNQFGINNLYTRNTLRTPINLPESTVKGFEFELQTNFQLYPVPDFLKGIVIGFNYARIYSSTHFPYYGVTTSRINTPPYVVFNYNKGLREGNIPGQANQIINLSLGYDLSDFSARVSMFYQDGSVNNIGSAELLDTYNAGFVRWDISLKQQIAENIIIFANIVNVNNRTDDTYQAFEYLQTAIQDYGRSVELGIQVKM